MFQGSYKVSAEQGMTHIHGHLRIQERIWSPFADVYCLGGEQVHLITLRLRLCSLEADTEVENCMQKVSQRVPLRDITVMEDAGPGQWEELTYSIAAVGASPYRRVLKDGMVKGG